VSERPAEPAAAAEVVRRQLAERWPETLERFRTEFERVGGVFHRVASIGHVPAVVGRIARERGVKRLVAWHPDALGADLMPALRAEGLTVESTPRDAGTQDRDASRSTTAHAEVGLTGADLAVGETGSLVLLSGIGRPRTTSLLPPYHVAFFDRTSLVESLEQVGILLEAWHADGRPPWWSGAINFITGPSRTADIELTLTRGVHGPKEVHAIFLDAAPVSGATPPGGVVGGGGVGRHAPGGLGGSRPPQLQ
jgi:L-lactate dehydrogenase complex protein LldG